MRRGRFITLEGGEGVGKTTALTSIMSLLGRRGLAVISTREPGGTALGESLRGLLLNPDIADICDDAELLMVFAARAQHIARVIEPALAQGHWVVSDRFTDASYAYQGGGRGLSPDRINTIEQWVQGDLRPDLTLLLDAPIEVGMSRAGKRGKLDRFEQEDFDFFERVRTTYLQRADAEPNRFCVIDASQSLEAVQETVTSSLTRFLERDCG